MKPSIQMSFSAFKMNAKKLPLFLAISIFLFLSKTSWSNEPLAKLDHGCKSETSQRVLSLWSGFGKKYLEESLLANRLLSQGDTYALYESEIIFHNFLSMLRRCEMRAESKQFIETISSAFSALENGPDRNTGKTWVCTGGKVCTKKNRLLGTPVRLYNLQFVALLADAANLVDTTSNSPAEKQFVQTVANIAFEHLANEATSARLKNLEIRIKASPRDVKDGTSELFLRDEELWLIAIHAELAGLIVQNPEVSKLSKNFELNKISQNLQALLQLLKSRTTFQNSGNAKLMEAGAELDNGFRQNHPDNRFAEKADGQPVGCLDKFANSDKSIKKDIQAPRPLGLDISHARRLVHLFDSVDRNRAALIKVFSIAPVEVISDRTMSRFAFQFRTLVWNQNTMQPLFANYFGGQNGWYRTGYRSSDSKCDIGIPPYGLSDSFLTGGYVRWAKWEPEIGVLGNQLFKILDSRLPQDIKFSEQYYRRFTKLSASNSRSLSQMMFWPSLVERLAANK